MRIHYDKNHNKNNCSCGCIYVGKLQGISNSELNAAEKKGIEKGREEEKIKIARNMVFAVL